MVDQVGHPILVVIARQVAREGDRIAAYRAVVGTGGEPPTGVAKGLAVSGGTWQTRAMPAVEPSKFSVIVTWAFNKPPARLAMRAVMRMIFMCGAVMGRDEVSADGANAW